MRFLHWGVKLIAIEIHCLIGLGAYMRKILVKETLFVFDEHTIVFDASDRSSFPKNGTKIKLIGEQGQCLGACIVQYALLSRNPDLQPIAVEFGDMGNKNDLSSVSSIEF